MKKRKIKKSSENRKWTGSLIAFLLLIALSILLNFNDTLGFSTKESPQTQQEIINEINTNNEIHEENNEQYEFEKQLTVHILDVGQADSIFIELPNQETMLIDAAEAKSADNIIQYIQNLGYSTIDYVIGTHPHADHIGGLSKVISTFSINSIYMPKAISTSKTYENLLNTIIQKGLKVKTATSGITMINENSLKVEFIAPNSESYKELNNYSAVVKITYGNQKFLFMGDAEEESEKEITADVSADVIKVGHHGSNTSSSIEFVKKVNPKYAIISVGENNSYNHPDPDIVSRWQSVGAIVYATKDYGNIIISSDGNVLNIKTSNN